MKNRKIKILIIPTGGMGIDGITSSIMNYYKYIDHHEFSITFVVTKIIGEEKHLKILKDKIVNNGDKVIEINRTDNQLNYFKLLLNLIKSSKFDVMHIHGSSSLMAIELLAGRLGRVKNIITHSHNTKCNHNFLNKLLKPVFKLLLDQKVACGIEAGKWLFDDEEFIVIKNGIETDKFRFDKNKREEVVNKLGLQGKKIIGHVGTFNKQKNHIFLIEILKELLEYDSKYHLLLIGDGKTKCKLEELVNNSNLSDNVTFYGRCTNVEEVLNVPNLMVLPSLHEGLPLVVIEWQSAGIRCVLSDSITKEVKITNLIEFISLEEKAKIWAKKINELYDYERNNKYSSEVIKAGYDISKNVETLVTLYKKKIFS